MLLDRYRIILILGLFTMATLSLFSQSYSDNDSEKIDQILEEISQTEQRIQTLVGDWKDEIKSMQEQIDKLEIEINKNRLIWTEEERQKNESEFELLVNRKSEYQCEKFQPGCEFDKVLKLIQKPIDAKLNEALEKMSEEERFDMLIRVNM